MHEDSGEQKEDSLSLSLFFYPSRFSLVCTLVHTYINLWKAYIYIYTHARTGVGSSFAVAKGKSGWKAGG